MFVRFTYACVKQNIQILYYTLQRKSLLRFFIHKHKNKHDGRVIKFMAQCFHGNKFLKEHLEHMTKIVRKTQIDVVYHNHINS